MSWHFRRAQAPTLRLTVASLLRRAGPQTGHLCGGQPWACRSKRQCHHRPAGSERLWGGGEGVRTVEREGVVKGRLLQLVPMATRSTSSGVYRLTLRLHGLQETRRSPRGGVTDPRPWHEDGAWMYLRTIILKGRTIDRIMGGGWSKMLSRA